MSGLTIAAIVVGVVGVLAVGTCTAGYFFVKREAEKVVAEIKDGGRVVVVSPEAVKVDLEGPKKSYVGRWRSSKGLALDIDGDGHLLYERDEDGDGHLEKIEGPIAAFKGDDIELMMIVKFTIHVASPPRESGGKWHMTADGQKLERID
jgi:hypothetical protein